LTDIDNISKSSLEYTGERFIPEERGKIELEHVHRYIFASDLVKGKTVLDIACGEGYGSDLLAGFASNVIGVDISNEAIIHAKEKYKKANLEYKQGSCDAIPLVDSSIDVVVSFETIEHHDKHEAMLSEIKRVLKPSGILIISSPEKHEHTDILGYNNPYHVKELYRHEFDNLISRYFKNMEYYGQRVIYGSAILKEDSPSFIHITDINNATSLKSSDLRQPLYIIAIATDSEIPLQSSTILEQQINQIEAIHLLIIKKDMQISMMTESLSWRITKPLRVLQRILEEGTIRQEHKEHLISLVRSIYKKLHLS
jgi:2-polyprenyl-3-methyl-5-hydroxy-6-metoxy-1,4-benzoquinol methylase